MAEVDDVEAWLRAETEIRDWLAMCLSRFGLTAQEPNGARLLRQLSVLHDRGDIERPASVPVREAETEGQAGGDPA